MKRHLAFVVSRCDDCSGARNARARRGHGVGGARALRPRGLGGEPPAPSHGTGARRRSTRRLIGEMVDVFRSSPFVHIGGDEVRLTLLDKDPEVRDFMERNGLSSVEHLYRFFLVRINDIVKRHDKKTIVWEGFRRQGEVEIPRDMTVMAWETMYQLPQELLADSNTIINVSWKPLYVVRDRRWTPETIYGWNMFRWENWWSGPLPLFPFSLKRATKSSGARCVHGNKRK